MRTRIKAIISTAAAAILSVGVIATASAANRSEKYTVPDELIRQENGLTPFEEAILMGESIHDPRISEESCGVLPEEFRNTQATTDSTSISLTKIHGHEDGYQLWSGTFTVDDVSAFSARFTEPDTFDCQMGNKRGTLTAVEDYSGNYKDIAIRLTYLENGTKVVKTASNEGNNNPMSARVNYSGSGELVEAAYYFYLNSGTGMGSGYYEVAAVHIVDRDYSQTALYAEEPYSGRIGTYTYVSPEIIEQLSAEVSFEFEEE